MEKGRGKELSFGQFINQTMAIILGFCGLVSNIAGIIKLVQGNAGIVAGVLLAIGLTFICSTCFYFARLWKPENDDRKDNHQTGLVPTPLDDKVVEQRRKKEGQRKLVRQLATSGLFLVPLLSIGFFGAWMYVQNLPNGNVVILVADFDGPKPQENRVTETILRELKDATKNYDEVRIVALEKAVTEQAGSDEARKLAEQKKADIVIWGWYGQTANTVPISANFEILDNNEYLPDDLGESASGAIQTFDVAELDSFAIQTRLSEEMLYLTFFTLGMTDYATENWTKAIAHFDNALSAANNSLDSFDLSITYFYQGTSYALHQDIKQAMIAFDQALNIKPDFREALNNKGTALSKLEQYEDAIEAYDQALKIEPDDHEALYNKGVALYNLGQYKNAIEVYDQALSIKPDKHKALYNKGIALYNLGQYEDAIEVFDQALYVKPNFHEALYSKGSALANLGQYEDAIEAFDQALNIKPNFYEALYNKGVTLAKLRQYEDAIEVYYQALNIKPNLHEALYNKGIALSSLEQYENAIKAFDQALKIKPDKHEALYSKGVALYYSERFDEAIVPFDQALTIKSDYHQALYGKALTYSLGNDTTNALQSLQKAIALNSDYRDLAKTDADLDKIRQDPRFQKLINAEP